MEKPSLLPGATTTSGAVIHRHLCSLCTQDNNYLVSAVIWGWRHAHLSSGVPWEAAIAARQEGDLRNVASMWGRGATFSSPAGSPTLGIKMARRRLSGESSVGDLPSSYLHPGFWSLLPAGRSRRDLTGCQQRQWGLHSPMLMCHLSS